MGIIIVITQTNSMFYDETTAAATAVAAAADVDLTVTTELLNRQECSKDGHTESSKCHLNFEVTSITTWEQSTEHRCAGAPSPTESLNAQ